MMTKNLKKFKAKKNLIFWGSKPTIHQASRKDVQTTVQKKPKALKREHSALKKMKFIFFSTFVDHFSLLDQDLDPDSESGSRSTDVIKSGH
jgi:hypothetical protein